MLDDKKSDTYQKIPDKFVPTTLVTDQSQDLISQMKSKGLSFPVIVKPDVGFKGFLVAKLESEENLLQFVKSFQDQSFIIQEYISYNSEYSILIYRYPISGKTGISSFIEKSFPSVIGDGKKTIGQLINESNNPFIDKSWIKKKWSGDLEKVLAVSAELQLDDIGNYSRGSKFHSMNHLLNQDYVEWAESLMMCMEGIDFCRIDLKADSEASMLKNEFKIMEINGAKSEPLHIYDPIYSFIQIILDVHQHWSILGAIVKERLQLSFILPSFKEGFKSFRIAKNIGK